MIAPVDIYLIFATVGWIGGGSMVGLLWILWWHWEQARPIHCSGCRCVPREGLEPSAREGHDF